LKLPPCSRSRLGWDRIERGADFLQGHELCDFAPQVPERNRLVFLVIGTNALARQHDRPVALISINCSHADTGVLPARMIASGLKFASISSRSVPKKALYRFFTMTISVGATCNSGTN